MSYTGQPVPTTVTALPVGKTHDGHSVRVEFGNNAVVVRGRFYYVDGFLGQAQESFTNAADATKESILLIEPAVYTIDQLAEGIDPVRGDRLYFDAAAGKFTTVATGNVFAGLVTVGKGAGTTVDFLLASQGDVTADTDAAALQAQIGDPADLETADQTDLVTAINEVNTNANAALARVADNVAAHADAANATAPEVAAIVNDILAAMKAAGLMAADA